MTARSPQDDGPSMRALILGAVAAAAVAAAAIAAHGAVLVIAVRNVL